MTEVGMTAQEWREMTLKFEQYLLKLAEETHRRVSISLTQAGIDRAIKRASDGRL